MTQDQFLKFGLDFTWHAPLRDTFALFGMDTPLRQAGFLGQCHHESAGFTRLEENLRYSATRLLAVWPKRFTTAEALIYSNQPEKIANRVYSNRMGNGNEASGDGWKYRGRGIIQITGKYNYQKCSEATGIPYVQNPDLALRTDGALTTAGWFFKANQLNEFSDDSNWEGLTRAINGGTLGLEDRIRLIKKYLDILDT